MPIVPRVYPWHLSARTRSVMALYAFETPWFLCFGLGFLAGLPVMLMLLSFDWVASIKRRRDQGDIRRLTQATIEVKRILGDRDRLHAEYALARKRFEESLAGIKAQAATEIAELRAEL